MALTPNHLSPTIAAKRKQGFWLHQNRTWTKDRVPQASKIAMCSQPDRDTSCKENSIEDIWFIRKSSASWVQKLYLSKPRSSHITWLLPCILMGLEGFWRWWNRKQIWVKNAQLASIFMRLCLSMKRMSFCCNYSLGLISTVHRLQSSAHIFFCRGSDFFLALTHE